MSSRRRQDRPSEFASPSCQKGPANTQKHETHSQQPVFSHLPVNANENLAHKCDQRDLAHILLCRLSLVSRMEAMILQIRPRREEQDCDEGGEAIVRLPDGRSEEWGVRDDYEGAFTLNRLPKTFPMTASARLLQGERGPRYEIVSSTSHTIASTSHASVADASATHTQSSCASFQQEKSCGACGKCMFHLHTCHTRTHLTIARGSGGRTGEARESVEGMIMKNKRRPRVFERSTATISPHSFSIVTASQTRSRQ